MTCCGCIFKPNKPKRRLFFWDIIAMTIFTVHDLVALILCIIAFCLAEKVEKKYQFPYFLDEMKDGTGMGVPLLLLILLTISLDFVIWLCMIEFGFRLLEDGPLIGKFVLAYLNLLPVVIFLAHLWRPFLYYTLFVSTMYSKKDYPKHRNVTKRLNPDFPLPTSADAAMDFFGLSIFHHFYVVLFVTVTTLIGKCIAGSKNKQGETQQTNPSASKAVLETTSSTVNTTGENEVAVQVEQPKDNVNNAIEELANLPPTVEMAFQGVAFTLQLESKSRSFLPGNEIKGKLKFDAPSEPVKIKISLEGNANVDWERKCCMCCKDPPFEGSQFIMQDEVETPEFRFTIPAEAAPTFIYKSKQGSGQICYKISANINLSSGVFLMDLPIVVRPIKNQTSPGKAADEPLVYYSEQMLLKLFGVLDMQRGPISCELTLKKDNFMVGEEIAFTAKLVNKSRRPVSNVTALLFSRINFLDGARNIREDTMTWQEEEFTSINSGSERTWTSSLKIPDNLPESRLLPFSNVIEFTQYIFRIRMEIQGISEDVLIDAPIILGPLGQIQKTFVAIPSVTAVPSKSNQVAPE